MIPSDLAARLRLLAESTIHPVAPVRGIPADLPELQLGQRFVARIESVLPDGTFRALVAGRSLTLALPQPARPGDSLDLVVTARAPSLILAESAQEAAGRSPATLSQTGRFLGALLAGDESSPRPAHIGRATPLLPAPQPQPDLLAPALRQAIVESGLFYESHQAQWIAGRYAAEALAREPQARYAGRPQAAGLAAAPQAAAAETPVLEAPPNAPAAAGRGAAAGMPAMPPELQALVVQQLDAAATQHLVWRAELWPGQGLHWEIAAQERHDQAPDEAPAGQWTTRLNLTLPHLGEVDATLTLAQGKVSLAMTASTESAGALRRGLAELAAAFADAGLPPLDAAVGTAK